MDLKTVAMQCPSNLTGADLYALCADAMMGALRRQILELERLGTGPQYVVHTYIPLLGKSDTDWEGKLEVCQEDFIAALQSLKPSISEEELCSYRNKKSIISTV